MSGVLLTVAYDGTDYAGWQRQQNALSVQEVLETALSKLTARSVTVIGGGRTDSGVHALGQRALIRDGAVAHIPIRSLPLAINTYLPPDIRVMAAAETADGFHPIRSAKNKTYRYVIYNGPIMSPLYARYAAFIPEPLDIAAMEASANHFQGSHDFAGFSSTGGKVTSTVREIYSLTVNYEEPLITITITGNGFLYNMVRIITGTLVLAGKGKINPINIPSIITTKDRTKAGITMPARGLTLINISYDNHCFSSL